VRAIFFGTPDIAVPALEALASIGEVVGVVCQPDRPAGRGLELRPPPVKVRALERGLEVVQPAKIRTPEFAEWIRSRDADVALVIAYGRILPAAVLTGPRRGCMNLHASLLPRLRGAAPITWAIVRGERETGISLMQMDEGCDTGPVYARHPLPIGEETTADELARELAKLAAEVVRRDLERAVIGQLVAEAQDESGATTAPILSKQDGKIDWDLPATKVHDHIRGMTSWPGAFTTSRGKRLVVLWSRVAAREGVAGGPGTVVRAAPPRRQSGDDRGGVEVACGTGSLTVLRAQVEGRKALDASELVAGRAIATGDVLGR